MPKAKITQTGPDSASVEPFVLRPGEMTRLVFKPQLVNSKRDENKPVKGRFIWQRRGSSERDEEWADESHFNLTEMTADSGIKLDLLTGYPELGPCTASTYGEAPSADPYFSASPTLETVRNRQSLIVLP